MGELCRDSYHKSDHGGLTASATPRSHSNHINCFIIRRTGHVSEYLISVKQGLCACEEWDCVAQLPCNRPREPDRRGLISSALDPISGI